MLHRLLAISLITTLALLAGCSKPDYETLEGERGHYAQWRGDWVVINYWAVWCKPCIDEIPELNEFSRLHADEVRVFGVNFDGGDPEQQRQQARQLQVAFPVLLRDPAGALGWERPKALPTTVVIDPQGEVRQQLQGPQTLNTLRAATGLKTNAETADDR